MPTDQDRLAAVLEEYKAQITWQQHNESQRSQLTNVLLVFSGAVLATGKWLNERQWMIAALLLVCGGLGAIAICKYWERFCYHDRIEKQTRKAIDRLLGDEPPELLQGIRQQALSEHLGSHKLFRDRRGFKQHTIWLAVFLLQAFLSGLALVVMWRR